MVVCSPVLSTRSKLSWEGGGGDNLFHDFKIVSVRMIPFLISPFERESARGPERS